MAKRGRKTGNSTSNKTYFGEVEEFAVVQYNLSNSAEEKNDIYEKILKPAFKIMIESIIRTYKLFGPEEDYQQTFDDALSFMMDKLSFYNPERGTKAYSYCGTIVKNYLIQKLKKHSQKLQRETPYEEVNSVIENNIKYINQEDNGAELANDLILTMAKQVRCILNSDESASLTENEKKIACALCELLDHWEEILEESPCYKESNKYKKSSVLYYLREETRLDTPEVREGMKKFKELYKRTKMKMLD